MVFSMTVRELDKIDFLAVDDDGSVSLVVSDDLCWGDELEHLALLQEKVYRYLDCVESRECFERASEAAGRVIPPDAPVKIVIVAKFALPVEGGRLVEHLDREARRLGVPVFHEVFEGSG